MRRNGQPGRVVVVGAGIGGLAAAAALRRAGFEVTVLEAQVYTGGCAGTFYNQGYLFDAGATLAGGFYPGGPMDLVRRQTGIQAWPVRPAERVMQVHLPAVGGMPEISLTRWNHGEDLGEAERRFGRDAVEFWKWQESTARQMWDLALRLPDWPPAGLRETAGLARIAGQWLGGGDQRVERLVRLPGLGADAFRSVSDHLGNTPEQFRLYIDSQLLISAQTTSRRANALYGAAALDLPRRGVAHVEGGMGGIAATICESLQQNGGRIQMRQEAQRVIVEGGRPVAVETRRGESFPADIVILNLPPSNAARLLGRAAPPGLLKRAKIPGDGWGAFVVYAGLDGSAVPAGFPLHHQVVSPGEPGEGNTIFMSISPEWDATRAPPGMRAVTMSTHTATGPWWELYRADRSAYQARMDAYTGRLMQAAERLMPGLAQAAQLVLPGTPVTFERFTRRAAGWVGGYPQTSLLRAIAPHISPGIWLVGDSIFPGQSTPAAALGGLRVAKSIIELNG